MITSTNVCVGSSEANRSLSACICANQIYSCRSGLHFLLNFNNSTSSNPKENKNAPPAGIQMKPGMKNELQKPQTVNNGVLPTWTYSPIYLPLRWHRALTTSSFTPPNHTPFWISNSQSRILNSPALFLHIFLPRDRHCLNKTCSTLHFTNIAIIWSI